MIFNTPFYKIPTQIKTSDLNAKKLTVNNKRIFFAMLVFIDVNLVCKFSVKIIIFDEVMIMLCLFIGYQPQFFQKSNFSYKVVILRN